MCISSAILSFPYFFDYFSNTIKNPNRIIKPNEFFLIKLMVITTKILKYDNKIIERCRLFFCETVVFLTKIQEIY